MESHVFLIAGTGARASWEAMDPQGPRDFSCRLELWCSLENARSGCILTEGHSEVRWDFSVVRWLRIHLAMQGTWVRSLVREDSTCLRAAKPGHQDTGSRCALSMGSTGEVPARRGPHTGAAPAQRNQGKPLCFLQTHASVLPFLPPCCVPRDGRGPGVGCVRGALTFMGAETIQEPYLVEEQSGRFGVVRGATRALPFLSSFNCKNDSKFTISCNSSSDLVNL